MTTTASYGLFSTAIGWCGLAWNGDDVVGVRLPEGDEDGMRRRLRATYPHGTEADPPAPVRRAVDAMVALLAGGSADLTGVSLDMSALPPFRRQVYERTRRVPPGQTITYGELARSLGAPGAARSVGQALGRNPFPIIVPCHRVVAANGRPGGFSATGGVDTKLRMLAIEAGASATTPAQDQLPGL
jgi:methylated-DNA-[protein]-cysteine S-methyltransferase